MNLRVVVAAHKPYWMPADPVYLPVQVGAAGKESIPGYTRDDSGENISAKNPHYCELTGLYWAWKNLPGDAIGLAHYRRHFARPGRGDKKARVMTGPELEQALNGVQAVLPTPAITGSRPITASMPTPTMQWIWTRPGPSSAKSGLPTCLLTTG